MTDHSAMQEQTVPPPPNRSLFNAIVLQKELQQDGLDRHRSFFSLTEHPGRITAGHDFSPVNKFIVRETDKNSPAIFEQKKSRKLSQSNSCKQEKPYIGFRLAMMRRYQQSCVMFLTHWQSCATLKRHRQCCAMSRKISGVDNVQRTLPSLRIY
jgi:hypothetical protein